jgi:hypothetical protein
MKAASHAFWIALLPTQIGVNWFVTIGRQHLRFCRPSTKTELEEVMTMSACFARLALVWAAALGVSTGASAATVEITIPGAPFVQYRFFHQLLKESLEANGHQVTLKSIEGVPQSQVYSKLETGAVTIFWGLKTHDRDQKFARVSNRLTNGLYGQRVAFVRKGQEALFQNVKSLDDLRKSGLVAGFGQIWFDVDVWRGNELPVHTEAGDWQVLFRLLASGKRGLDYFPRSVVEINEEAATHPGLSIEPNLLMVYDHDVFFYVSKSAEQLVPLVQAALAKADSSGLKARLIETHFGQNNRQLNLDKRTRISLKTPSQAHLIKELKK